jgi:hypothetical protein
VSDRQRMARFEVVEGDHDDADCKRASEANPSGRSRKQRIDRETCCQLHKTVEAEI